MKILTLNLHCFAEKKVKDKQKRIAQFIHDRQLDIVFFQEVAQPYNNSIILDRVKKQNYAYSIQNLLKELGSEYDLYYDFSKRGFGIYDEGLAIMSKTKLMSQRSYYVSKNTDYHDWHTRMNVSCETFIENQTYSLTSLHLGWTEGDEVFEDQFDRTHQNLDPSKIQLICGDFNISEDSKEYEHILQKGYIDLYHNGEDEFFHQVTHMPNIDVKTDAKRIDYVFSNKPHIVLDREIVFKDNPVSDHFGVYMEIKLEDEQ